MIGLLGFGDSTHKVIAYDDKVYVRLYRWDTYWNLPFTEIVIAENNVCPPIFGLPVKLQKSNSTWEIMSVVTWGEER